MTTTDNRFYRTIPSCPISVFWDGSKVRIMISEDGTAIVMTRDQAIDLAQMLVNAVKAGGVK
jgi:hypothetical protein